MKPENLVLDSTGSNFNIKIIDMGLGQTFEKSRYLNRSKGSVYYTAPEQIKGKYNEKVDIWSCGVILYILITGLPPFSAFKTDQHGRQVLDVEEVKRLIEKGHVDFTDEIFQDVSPELIPLLKRMLTYEAEERPEASQLMHFPWLHQTSEKGHRQEGGGVSSLIGSFQFDFVELALL